MLEPPTLKVSYMEVASLDKVQPNNFFIRAEEMVSTEDLKIVEIRPGSEEGMVWY